MATTVLVVDDHSGFRSCVRRLLERQGYLVIGEADPAPAVVLTSSHDRSDVDGRVVTSGARGFVRKDELSRDAIEALL